MTNPDLPIGHIAPASEPNPVQAALSARRYGLFIHFGINTFLDREWTEGTDAPQCYAPSAVDTDDWVRTAKEAGMRHVVLTAKHHEGFCLWPTEATGHGVLNSGNPTDVVESLAESCRREGIALGLYYSLWDRHWGDGCMRAVNPAALSPGVSRRYVDYMLAQLEELLGRYGPVCELWLDGGWVQPRTFWNIPEVYALVKRLQPDCALGVNWSIGHPDNIDTFWPDRPLAELTGTARQLGDWDSSEPHPPIPVPLPEHQRAGQPIRYFPSDFRLGDPFLPAEDDPKLFTHEGETYYLPFEATVCLNDLWFYNSTDRGLKSVDELEAVYRRATANDNALLLNSPPDRSGRMPAKNRQRLEELRKRLSATPATTA